MFKLLTEVQIAEAEAIFLCIDRNAINNEQKDIILSSISKNCYEQFIYIEWLLLRWVLLRKKPRSFTYQIPFNSLMIS